MKKHFLSVVMVMLTFSMLHAQNSSVGITGGIDASRMAVAGASGGPLKYRTDLTGGIFFENAFSSNIGIQVEANYSAQGTGLISDDGSTIGSIRVNYITLPVLLKFYGSQRLSFFAGPQVGFLISAKTKTNGQEETEVDDQFKKTDFYAVFGGEYKFASGFFINARYNVGITNVVDEDELPENEFKNRYFSFRVGYAFKL
jgi:hypothetical protein